MIDIYLTDLINIIDKGLDEWGAPNDSTQSNIKARFEDKNEMVRDKNGAEVISKGFLLIDKDAIITYESKIVLKKILGDIVQLDGKELGILQLKKAHGFENSHWEVWL